MAIQPPLQLHPTPFSFTQPPSASPNHDTFEINSSGLIGLNSSIASSSCHVISSNSPISSNSKSHVINSETVDQIILPLQKSNIDTKNCDFLRELPFPNNQFLSIHVSFRGVFQIYQHQFIISFHCQAFKGWNSRPSKAVNRYPPPEDQFEQLLIGGFNTVSTHLKNISQI